jgi:alpha-D-ribose 1-methylphosphonate 5-triphosphate synthase subunit PhnG
VLRVPQFATRASPALFPICHSRSLDKKLDSRWAGKTAKGVQKEKELSQIFERSLRFFKVADARVWSGLEVTAGGQTCCRPRASLTDTRRRCGHAYVYGKMRPMQNEAAHIVRATQHVTQREPLQPQLKATNFVCDELRLDGR